MREFFRIIAALLSIASGLAAAISLLALFTDSSSQLPLNGAMLCGSVMVFLLSGAVYLLAEISKSLHSSVSGPVRDSTPFHAPTIPPA